jgi:hypothetical protein
MSNRAGSLQAEWQAKLHETSPFSISPSSWWYNPTNHSSLRLTQNAYMQVRKEIKFYKFHHALIEVDPEFGTGV